MVLFHIYVCRLHYDQILLSFSAKAAGLGIKRLELARVPAAEVLLLN